MTAPVTRTTMGGKVGDHERRIRKIEFARPPDGSCHESSLGAYEGNPSGCEIAPGGGLHPRMGESLGPIRYVDTVGGDDNDDGLTTGTAWMTVANVGTEDFHGMQPGWIIRVKGTMDSSNTEDFNVDDCPSGTFEQPITFEPWPGETAPKFDNQYVYGGGDVEPHPLGEGWPCYYRFRGFTADVADSAGNGTYGGFIEFDGCEFNGVFHTLYGNDNTVIGCTFTDSVLQGYTQQSGVGHSQGHRLSVLNCLFDGSLSDFTEPQIHLISDDTPPETLLEDVILSNNTHVNMTDAPTSAMVRVQGATGLRIVNNIFAHSVNAAISSEGTYGGTDNAAVRNLYFDVDANIVVAGGASPIADGGENITSDPLFMTDPGDYALQSASPANDAADPWWVPAADILGANRPNTVAGGVAGSEDGGVPYGPKSYVDTIPDSAHARVLYGGTPTTVNEIAVPDGSNFHIDQLSLYSSDGFGSGDYINAYDGRIEVVAANNAGIYGHEYSVISDGGSGTINAWIYGETFDLSSGGDPGSFSYMYDRTVSMNGQGTFFYGPTHYFGPANVADSPATGSYVYWDDVREQLQDYGYSYGPHVAITIGDFGFAYGTRFQPWYDHIEIGSEGYFYGTDESRVVGDYIVGHDVNWYAGGDTNPDYGGQTIFGGHFRYESGAGKAQGWDITVISPDEEARGIYLDVTGVDAANSIALYVNNGLVVPNLPTADPGVSGALWNLLGVVQVSP